jgi:hypothetical protein
MTLRRDPDAILAAWLEEGPHVLPESTRRGIEVTTRTTNQARRLPWLPWRATHVNGMTRVALAAAAVAAIAVGGLVLLRPGSDESGVGGPRSPVPSASGSASPSIPAMTQSFTSEKYGYSVRYPADWRVEPATTLWFPPDWGASGSDLRELDEFVPVGDLELFRAASALAPDAALVDDWIAQFITMSNVAECNPPRETLEQVVIGGEAGRLRGFCGNPPATEIEATVVVGRRVYVFTLFNGGGEGSGAIEADERALFDAFTSTIELHPEDAQAPASIVPGPS